MQLSYGMLGMLCPQASMFEQECIYFIICRRKKGTKVIFKAVSEFKLATLWHIREVIFIHEDVKQASIQDDEIKQRFPFSGKITNSSENACHRN